MKDNFRTALSRLGKSDGTIKSYISRFNDFYHFLINDLNKFDVFEVTQVDIVSYKEHLMKLHQTRDTINGKINAVSLFYNLAELNGKVATNPVPKGIRLKSQASEIPFLSDLKKELIKEWINKLPLEMGASLWLMYGAGLRSGEVIKLINQDVVLDNDRVYIVIHDDKDRFRHRTIPVLDRDAARSIIIYKKYLAGKAEEKFLNVSKNLIHSHMVAFTNYTGIDLYAHLLRYNIGNYLRANDIDEEYIKLYLGEKPKQFFRKGEDKLDYLLATFHTIFLPITPKITDGDDPSGGSDNKERGIV